MKKTIQSLLPAVVLGLGILGFGLRKLLYLAAVDQRGLLVPGHPLAICLCLLTAGVMGLIFLTVRKLEGSNGYEENFPPSLPGFLGQAAMAAAVAYTVVPSAPQLPGTLGMLWKLLGIASVPCLMAAGYFRLKGQKPFFLLQTLPCLFLLMHIVNHYRDWSSQPQLQNYCFTLLALMALVLFAFYCGSFAVEMPKRKLQRGVGLAALYLCLVALASSDAPWLLLGGAAWSGTGLCALEAKPAAPEQGGPA